MCVRIFFCALILIIFSCSEEPPINTTTPKIRFVEPSNNFHIKEFDSLHIKIETECDMMIKSVKLFAIDEEEWFDTSDAIVVFTKKPYEHYFRMPEICIGENMLTLFASAQTSTGGEIKTEYIIGHIVKDLLPDSLLIKYAYKGFDLDSNLIVEGLLTIMIKDTIGNSIQITGRKYLNAIDEDLALEKGEGFTKGYFQPNGEIYLDLSYCKRVVYQGRPYNIVAFGSFSETTFYGTRILVSIDPAAIPVGTFQAKKI